MFQKIICVLLLVTFGQSNLSASGSVPSAPVSSTSSSGSSSSSALLSETMLQAILEQMGKLNDKIEVRLGKLETTVHRMSNPPRVLKFKMPGTRDHLKVVLQTLDKLGYQETSGADWDVLWAFRYPWTEKNKPDSPYASALRDISRIRSGQMINHWKSIGFLVNKELLGGCTAKRVRQFGEVFDITPKTFNLPEQFNDFAKEFEKSEKLTNKISWVKKGKAHREIVSLTSVEEAKQYDHSNSALAQQYIHSHLIDGHKFDLGFYVAITSVIPLRFYVYDDILVRICKYKYPSSKEEFDTNLGAWVVDDYIPIWESKTMQKLYRGNNLDAILDYFKGVDAEKGASLQAAIYHRIRLSLLSVKSRLQSSFRESVANSNGRTRHAFFEMVRFDFLIDQDLVPWVTEVNMSPNLVPKNVPDGQMKQAIVDDLFTLVGLNRTRNAEVEQASQSSHSAKRESACPDTCLSHPSSGNTATGACLSAPDCFAMEEGEEWQKFRDEISRNSRHWQLVYPVASRALNEVYSKFEDLDKCEFAAATVAPAKKTKQQQQQKQQKQQQQQQKQQQQAPPHTQTSTKSDENQELDSVRDLQEFAHRRVTISLKVYEWCLFILSIAILRRVMAFFKVPAKSQMSDKEKSQ